MSAWETVAKQTKEEQPKKAEGKAPKPQPAAAPAQQDAFAALRKEQELLQGSATKTHRFVGIWGADGTGKSGIVMDAFGNDPNKAEGATLHALDFDMGSSMLASAIHPDENIVSWNPWAMGTTDRTAYDYNATHSRVMNIMKYIVSEVRAGKPVWGVLISGVDSWLEICTNNMRIVDLGLAADGIEAADGQGAAKVESQASWAIRNTRFHQLTQLSRDLVRLGVSVYWETHEKMTGNFYGPESGRKAGPDWEKKTTNYIPNIIRMESIEVKDESGNVASTNYVARFVKCKTNPALQDQERVVFTTKADEEPVWFGLPELYTEL
jgi:hypothetical protein